MPLLSYAHYTTTQKDSWAGPRKRYLGRLAHRAYKLWSTSDGASQENIRLAFTFFGALAMEDKKRKAVDLVNRIHGGDMLAEGELVQHYGRAVLLMLEQRTEDRQLAADLYQETFVIVIERLRRKPLNDPHNLGAFIYGTGKNLLVGDLRKKARRKTFADTNIVSETADSNLGPFQNVSRDEEARIVHQIISSMRSKRDRTLLMRFYIDEEEKEKICLELNLSSLHFNRVLFRARRRFKELLTGYNSSHNERISG
jgi:RNA polymerase sigma-70 factor (ECF subfamily)